MAAVSQHEPPGRLLIVMPSWVGDTVMAMPTVSALRTLYPQAHIAALARPAVEPIIDACPWIDQILSGNARSKSTFALVRRLRRQKFDMAVVLPNSFRSALTVKMARVPRRVGYDRDGRGFLLTDRLVARRAGGEYVPVPTRDYYLGIASYLGAADADPTMRLFTHEPDDEQARQLLTEQGCPPQESPLVLLIPGAAYGPAKRWLPQRFAQVADRCGEAFGAKVLIGGAAHDRDVVDQVAAAMNHTAVNLPALGVDLRLFKSIVRLVSLLISNDTGPRHIAAAFGVPVVTIFGPTDPAWSHIGFDKERQVMVKVECGPCQLKTCPLDHRCMKQIDTDMVFEHAAQLLDPKQP